MGIKIYTGGFLLYCDRVVEDFSRWEYEMNLSTCWDFTKTVTRNTDFILTYVYSIETVRYKLKKQYSSNSPINELGLIASLGKHFGTGAQCIAILKCSLMKLQGRLQEWHKLLGSSSAGAP